MTETRRSYHQEIDLVREEIVRMASSVVEVIPRGTTILLDGDRSGDAQPLLLTTRETERRRLQPALDFVPQGSTP